MAEMLESLVEGGSLRRVSQSLGASGKARSYGYSNQMGYQTSDFRLLWTITPNPPPPPPQHPF